MKPSFLPVVWPAIGIPRHSWRQVGDAPRRDSQRRWRWRRRSFCLLVAFVGPVSADGPEYQFVDVTDVAGVANGDHAHFGCTWSDYDGDGLIDLYSANDDANTLYRNNGDGTFTDVTKETGTGDPFVAMRNVWADYDRDGDLDFYSHNFVHSTLYQNNGNVFTDVNDESGAGLDMLHGTGMSWGDYDRDGWLDMHCTMTPQGWNVLFHNNGDGTFTDLAVEAGLQLNAEGMGNIFSDFNNDGFLDIGVAAVPAMGDFNFLYSNNGDGTFSPATESLNIALEEGASTASIVFVDYDNDLQLDLLLTEVELLSQKALPNRYYLFRNLGEKGFVDVTDAVGITAPVAEGGDPELEFWDASFADYDNDGDQDLYMGINHGRNLLYQNNGDGTFTEIAAALGVDYPESLKGMCWGDYDNDGDLDLYVMNRNAFANGDEPSVLLENTGGSNNWLQLDLRGTVSNFDAIGARVRVLAPGLSPQIQEIYGGSGFFDQHTRILNFGLAQATEATVSIRWPNGLVQDVGPLAANQRFTFIEPSEIAGDFNGDGFVGSDDLLFLLGSWGPCDACGACVADLDGDCVVGTPDLLILLGNWG